ncbi:hypothetical protein [Flavobacterium sp. SM2513]|uniref:hypothetical protein n=1 Tax=Flavobacterium sp. SM2513 TaxID=3424766 RepID=UPI003D7F5022
MKTTNQPADFYDNAQDPQPNFMFNTQSDEDRKEREEEREDEEATMDDWGEVDPAGGPAPSAPGSAV